MLVALGLKGLPRRLMARKSFWEEALAEKIPSTILQRTVQRNSRNSNVLGEVGPIGLVNLFIILFT